MNRNNQAKQMLLQWLKYSPNQNFWTAEYKSEVSKNKQERQFFDVYLNFWGNITTRKMKIESIDINHVSDILE